MHIYVSKPDIVFKNDVLNDLLKNIPNDVEKHSSQNAQSHEKY